jgi:hypothetical protein
MAWHCVRTTGRCPQHAGMASNLPILEHHSRATTGLPQNGRHSSRMEWPLRTARWVPGTTGLAGAVSAAEQQAQRKLPHPCGTTGEIEVPTTATARGTARQNLWELLDGLWTRAIRVARAGPMPNGPWLQQSRQMKGTGELCRRPRRSQSQKNPQWHPTCPVRSRPINLHVTAHEKYTHKHSHKKAH